MATREEQRDRRRQAYENFVAEQASELRDWLVKRDTEMRKEQAKQDKKLHDWLAKQAG